MSGVTYTQGNDQGPAVEFVGSGTPTPHSGRLRDIAESYANTGNPGLLRAFDAADDRLRALETVVAELAELHSWELANLRYDAALAAAEAVEGLTPDELTARKRKAWMTHKAPVFGQADIDCQLAIWATEDAERDATAGEAATDAA